MIGVILAAGRGRRLGELTQNRPKPLLTVGSRPIIEHILRGMRAATVNRAIIVVGYLGEQLVRALGTGSELGMEIHYVWQKEPRGTAEALLLTRDVVSGPFLLSWGDVLISSVNYRLLLQAFAQRPAAAWIGVNDMEDPAAGAAVYVDADGRVRRVVEKPPPGTSSTRWNNAGVGVYTPVVFEYAERTMPSVRGERELPSALDAMVASGEEVYALPIVGFWSDVGTPEALAWAERNFGNENA